MKTKLFIAITILVTVLGCTRDVASYPEVPVKLQGRWTLVAMQSPGTGGAGVWRAASPAGQWMELSSSTGVTGTVFGSATGYAIIDSANLKIIDPTIPAGYMRFTYFADTVNRELLFYIRPTGTNTFCTEGCGAYEFSR